MDNEQKYAYEAMCQLKTEEAVNVFLNFYGIQLLTPEFQQFLVDEGIMNE